MAAGVPRRRRESHGSARLSRSRPSPCSLSETRARLAGSRRNMMLRSHERPVTPEGCGRQISPSTCRGGYPSHPRRYSTRASYPDPSIHPSTPRPRHARADRTPASPRPGAMELDAWKTPPPPRPRPSPSPRTLDDKCTAAPLPKDGIERPVTLPRASTLCLGSTRPVAGRDPGSRRDPTNGQGTPVKDAWPVF